MSAAADDLFCWEDLDQRLISPKTNELAEEMQRRSAEAEGAIGFKTAQSGNSAGYLPRLFDFHEKLADEWAERLYAAHCETWSQQNRTISPEFIRAVRDRPVAQLIAARKLSLQAQVCLRGMRIGKQPNPTALEEWDRRMDRLATRWNSKLEADAVACEYRLSKNQQISNSPRADSAKEAATDLPDLLNEPAGMQYKSDRLLSSYRSEIKRAILTQLALKPKATDVEICRGLDADGSVELPSSWKSRVSDRSFFDAYSDAVRRHKVEVTISKVRKDLRRQGLLD